MAYYVTGAATGTIFEIKEVIHQDPNSMSLTEMPNLLELQGKVVLNVDDNEMNHLVISKILEKLGLHTIPAFNGAEAVQKLNDGLKPDAILMDLQMPIMDGMQATEFIRKRMQNDIPIIINSGNIEDLERWRLRRLGIRDFLEKPYTIKDISNKLCRNILMPQV